MEKMETQRQSTPTPRRGVGAILGRGVNSILRKVVQIVALIFFLFWTIIGGIFNFVVMTPIGWFTSGSRRDVPLRNLAKVVFFAIVVAITGFALYPSSEFSTTVSEWMWSIIPERRGPIYAAPSLPPQTADELISRLSQVESSLADLIISVSSKEQRSVQQSQRAADQMQTRMDSVVQSVREAVEGIRMATAQGIAGLRHDIDSLQINTEKIRSAVSKDDIEDVRNRLASVEGGMKEAMELAAKKTEPQTGFKWNSNWKSGLTIKSSDGKDVSALINSMVDQAFSNIYKDGIAKADFALYSAGGRTIPTLTTDTYEVKPKGWSRSIVGALTGSGYSMGRSPVYALHPDNHVGNCWPFKGSQGQLGILLARIIYVSEITIEHAAREVAFDIQTAPKQMELWGLVEGKDNIAKVRQYHDMLDQQRAAEVARAKAEGRDPPPDENEYPPSIPRSPHYIRLARFTYDIHSPHVIQTFPVPQEIQDIGADFGTVILRVKNNWGEEDYTCLYRVRVHGTEKDRKPLLQLEDAS